MSAALDIAIEVLSQQAQNAQTNAPIHAAEGNAEQAALDRRVFESCLDAIERLKGGSQ